MSPTQVIISNARQAFQHTKNLPSKRKTQILYRMADLLEQHSNELLENNQKDILQSQPSLAPALLQRLRLDSSKVRILIQGIRQIAQLPDPSGHMLQRTELDAKLILEKVSVPIGVLLFIFESRPDVAPQFLSLLLKSGNTAILKGGKETQHVLGFYAKLFKTLHQEFYDLPRHWFQFIESRETVTELLAGSSTAHAGIDLIIPRGSNELIQSIQSQTRIPVLGHADGVCHIYVHSDANLPLTKNLIIDAKAQSPSACNALETLLLHRSLLDTWVPKLIPTLQKQGIEVLISSRLQALFPNLKTVSDWHTEYSDLRLAVEIVDHIDQAISHIERFGSHHTDAICTEDPDIAKEFLNRVDSANVYWNTSTRFADGFRYGFGAEVGISTSKLHARGPVGLEGLCTYQYRLRGNYHQVSDYVGSRAKSFTHKALAKGTKSPQKKSKIQSKKKIKTTTKINKRKRSK